LETIDVALIGEATKQVDVAAYALTDRGVVEALRLTSARVEAQLGGRVAHRLGQFQPSWRDAARQRSRRIARRVCMRRV
jgi:hypothetical protein